MVQIGLQPEESTGKKIRYAVGTAEKLGEAGVGEGEEGVDLVIAGMSCIRSSNPVGPLECGKVRLLLECSGMVQAARTGQ